MHCSSFKTSAAPVHGRNIDLEIKSYFLLNSRYGDLVLNSDNDRNCT